MGGRFRSTQAGPNEKTVACPTKPAGAGDAAGTYAVKARLLWPAPAHVGPGTSPISSKVKLSRETTIGHPNERYGHVSEVPEGAPMLLQPRLGNPPGHGLLAALSLVDHMEPAASLAPTHVALAGLTHSEHRMVAEGEADVYGVSTCVCKVSVPG